ncbi:uncharacterized protein [Taeniopygia guttata]|uniref:uncharacterized protein n=1 Tax=Taeniopygia guttata TaxID=59729 RepID=UPI003BB90009
MSGINPSEGEIRGENILDVRPAMGKRRQESPGRVLVSPSILRSCSRWIIPDGTSLIKNKTRVLKFLKRNPAEPRTEGTRHEGGTGALQPPRGTGSVPGPGRGKDTGPGSGKDTGPGRGKDTGPGRGKDTGPGSGISRVPAAGRTQVLAGGSAGSRQGEGHRSWQGDQPGPGSGKDADPGSGKDTGPGRGISRVPAAGQPPGAPSRVPPFPSGSVPAPCSAPGSQGLTLLQKAPRDSNRAEAAGETERNRREPGPSGGRTGTGAAPCGRTGTGDGAALCRRTGTGDGAALCRRTGTGDGAAPCGRTGTGAAPENPAELSGHSQQHRPPTCPLPPIPAQSSPKTPTWKGRGAHLAAPGLARPLLRRIFLLRACK